jgi:hypothetical protein
MSEGISRKWLEPWLCTGLPSVIPNSVYLRVAVELWSRVSFRTLEVQSGLGARGSFAWKSPPMSILSRPLGLIFLGRKQNGEVVGGAANGQAADTCLYVWASRERLGKGIKCGDLLASSLDSPIGLTPGYKYGARGFIHLYLAFLTALSFLVAVVIHSLHPWRERARSFLLIHGFAPR